MSLVGDCPECGAPRGMIGWLCNCWLPKERRYKPPQWMIDDYNKKKKKEKNERLY